MRKILQDLLPYDPGLTIEQIERKTGKKVTKLSANESLWGPSPKVYEALQQSSRILQYYPDGTAWELRNLLASNWDLPIEHFCLGNGADELIYLLTNTILNPGEEVVIPTPTFSSYFTAAQLADARVKIIQQKELFFDLTELARNVQNNTKIVFLCNPNNPTGAIFTQQELENFLANIPTQTIVILDEAYCHYVTEKEYPLAKKLIKRYANLVILRTFSKVYGLASLRIGYTVASPMLISELQKVRQPYNVNSFAQLAALSAWQDYGYLQKVIQETIKERERLKDKLEVYGFKVIPSQANFLLVRHKNALLIDKLLYEDGFLVRNTASFGLPDCLRITVGPTAQMNSFLESLAQIMLRLES